MPKRPNQTLSDFGKSAMALVERLQEEPRIDVIEQVFIENHLHILQSAYSSWKRRNTKQAERPANPGSEYDH